MFLLNEQKKNVEEETMKNSISCSHWMAQLSVQNVNFYNNSNNTGVQKLYSTFFTFPFTHFARGPFLLKMNDASTLNVNCRLSTPTHPNYDTFHKKFFETPRKRRIHISTRWFALLISSPVWNERSIPQHICAGWKKAKLHMHLNHHHVLEFNPPIMWKKMTHLPLPLCFPVFLSLA